MASKVRLAPSDRAARHPPPPRGGPRAIVIFEWLQSAAVRAPARTLQSGSSDRLALRGCVWCGLEFGQAVSLTFITAPSSGVGICFHGLRRGKPTMVSPARHRTLRSAQNTPDIGDRGGVL